MLSFVFYLAAPIRNRLKQYILGCLAAAELLWQPSNILQILYLGNASILKIFFCLLDSNKAVLSFR